MHHQPLLRKIFRDVASFAASRWRVVVTRRHTFWIIVGVATLLVVVVIVGVAALLRAPRSAEHSSIPADSSLASPIEVHRRLIDGTLLADGAVEPLRLAIVIDNAPEARPQSGLADAPLVFELPVEGRRTRFLAVFPVDVDVREIGPVRSARPYMADLAQAIGAPLVHVGGSPEALSLLKNNGWPHINQYYDSPFWRSRFRSAPFNVYASVSELASFVSERSGWGEKLNEAIDQIGAIAAFDDTIPEGAASVDQVEIRYGAGHIVNWLYDNERRRFVRSQDGHEHRDADGQPIVADSVVILHVQSRVLDEIGRLAIQAFDSTVTHESAPAEACVLDQCIVGVWSFGNSEAGMLGLRRVDGTPISLRPGTTWIEVLDQRASVTPSRETPFS
ncbi:MAG: DUF3048 domain-containing protein [Candidatus Uhrbacteria bacterium]